jgi:aspartyl-tRNA(Asn)/glutamyl-tRNA(Gln) amidotransferase subunit A
VVAAGDVPLSLGSDTGGSIRQPAAFCGVTGLKPTYGRVSRYGLVAFASSLDQVGPLAWDVEGVARLLQATSGYDRADSTSLDIPTPDYLAAAAPGSLKGVWIGVLRKELEAEGLSDSVRQAVLDSIEVFTEAGARVVDVQLPHSRYCVPTYYVIAPCEASSNLSRYDGAHYGHRATVSAEQAREDGPLMATYCRSRAEGFGSEVKRRIMLGTYALSAGYYDAYYLRALKVRRLIRQDYDQAFADVDLLLGPVSPTPAFPLGEKLDDPIQMYLCDLFTVGANLAGLPALSLPAGFDAEGLPLGVQLQAPPLEEGRLLRAGAALQAHTDWHRRRPSR